MRGGRVGAGVAAAAVLVAACLSDRPDPTAVLPDACRALAEAAGAGAGDVVVGMVGFAFVPAEVEVEPGTEVTWVNCEPEGTTGGEHTSTADDASWDSPLMVRGEVFRRVFDEGGDHPYHCEPHPFMTGRIRVGS